MNFRVNYGMMIEIETERKVECRCDSPWYLHISNTSWLVLERLGTNYGNTELERNIESV